MRGQLIGLSDDPITVLVARLREVIPPRGIQRAAREMDVNYTTLYDVLTRAKQPRPDTRQKMLLWLATHSGASLARRATMPSSEPTPREQLVSLIVAAEEEIIPDILKAVRRVLGKHWARTSGDTQPSTKSR